MLLLLGVRKGELLAARWSEFDFDQANWTLPAARIKTRRKGKAALWGLLWLHAFIALRLTIKLAADGFGANKVYALFEPGEFWRDMLRRLVEVVWENPSVSFVVPTLIWFCVAFSLAEWSSFRQQILGADERREG